jgi:tetratricopeptide (TPR) repeat protein
VVALILRVAEFTGPGRWRWLLTDEDSGQPLADHPVSLNPADDDFRAFADLYRYLRWNAVPDRRTASEAEIVSRVGAWAGQQVLGESIGQAIAEAAPVTVRVEVPVGAGFLLGWPLELAHAAGLPLAAREDVALIYDLAAEFPGGTTPRPATSAEEPLRMLAVFSLPTRTSVLALRRERYQLARLIRRIRARGQRQVELTLLQYGVTRKRLTDIVDSGAGWDVLHLSGHGGRGQFLLETADGHPDEIDTSDLVKILRPLRRRVRLAVVSACESAAATTAETLRWMGLTDQAEELEQQDLLGPAGVGDPARPVGPAHEAMTGIARALVAQLGCAVVAMRYPVTDEFAMALTETLYERLIGRGQPLDTALGRAVPEAAGPQPSPARPAICLATPVLVGTQATGMRLHAPQLEPTLNPAKERMADFPPEPERFVGRAQAMAQASATLAAGSGKTGVLLHGMAGAGKTACALELSYRHEDSFAAVAFWQAPKSDDEFGAALGDLAGRLDIQLGGYGFTMSDKITTVDSLMAFAPRLRLLLQDNGILLVLDNLETLLTPDGNWRDPRWEPLIEALTAHQGESRVILTSRIRPAGLSDQIVTKAVHALDLGESAALARELPGLRALLHADASPLRDGDETTVAADRTLVRRVLHVVQGHPKLMELADAAAADPARLAAQVAAAEDRADGQVLDQFFRQGTTGVGAAQFLDALASWTKDTLATLSDSAELMGQFLACLEEHDRHSWVVQANWSDLWQRLARPGEPPEWQPLITTLIASALIQPDPPPESGKDPELVRYQMHPGVAQAIRASPTADIQTATDAELAAMWWQFSSRAREQEGGEAGHAIIHAGLAAAPYLLRLKDWDAASALLEQVMARDDSPATIQAALPALRAIVDATQASEHLALLAQALTRVDPAEAEKLLRASLARAVASKAFALASPIAGALINLLRNLGRLREALDLTDQKADYTRQAGLGPWTQLADQGWRLQILGLMGEHQQVLDQISTFQAQMNNLSAVAGEDETIEPWNVRETILDTFHTSALTLNKWQLCLDLNAAVLASERARGASAYDIASTLMNDSAPLIELGRSTEAEQILNECQEVFEDEGDLRLLGMVFDKRARLYHKVGNHAGALASRKTAIRFAYLNAEPYDVAISHNNLAFSLRTTGSDPPAQRAHRIASAVIRWFTGDTHGFVAARQRLASEMREDTGSDELPATLYEVVGVAEQTEGVHLGRLIAALAPDPQEAENVIAQILDTAAATTADQDAIRQHVQNWEPVIVMIVAAAGGDQDVAAELAPLLDKLAEQQDWAALVAVLRRVLGGEHRTDLLDGLDSIDRAIATEVLTRLAPPPADSTREQA